MTRCASSNSKDQGYKYCRRSCLRPRNDGGGESNHVAVIHYSIKIIAITRLQRITTPDERPLSDGSRGLSPPYFRSISWNWNSDALTHNLRHRIDNNV